MRIAMGAGSEVLGTPMRPQDIVGDVVAAEAEGFRSAWTVHFSRGVDALGVLAVAGTRTSRIDLGVGIVPTYPRHPLALAQQAATAQAFCGGRLTLGVGVSHRPVIEDLHGLSYQQPAAYMRDYLSVLVPLLREGSVRYRGSFYEVDGGFTVPGTSPVSVLVGALSPLMVQAAGELADGVVTRRAGPRTLGEQIVPQLRRAAGPRSAAWRLRDSATDKDGACSAGDSGRTCAPDCGTRKARRSPPRPPGWDAHRRSRRSPARDSRTYGKPCQAPDPRLRADPPPSWRPRPTRADGGRRASRRAHRAGGPPRPRVHRPRRSMRRAYPCRAYSPHRGGLRDRYPDRAAARPPHARLPTAPRKRACRARSARSRRSWPARRSIA